MIWKHFLSVPSVPMAIIWLSTLKRKGFSAKKTLLWFPIVSWSHKTKHIVILASTITSTILTHWVANLTIQTVLRTVKFALHLVPICKDVNVNKVLLMMFSLKNALLILSIHHVSKQQCMEAVRYALNVRKIPYWRVITLVAQPNAQFQTVLNAMRAIMDFARSAKLVTT